MKLSTPTGGVFYSQTLNGFTVKGNSPRRRWSLDDAERDRTGIERLIIDRADSMCARNRVRAMG